MSPRGPVNIILAAVLAALPVAALAEYPEKPVTVVVPNKAGGGLDLVVRIVTDKLSADTGQPFVVQNKPGAGTAIGSRDVNSAAPDGYTILVNHEALLTLNAMGRLGFEVANLDPVAKTGGFANFLVAGRDTPYSTLPELCAYAKEHPGKVTAPAQIGALSHFHILSAEAACEADFNIVNEKGAGGGFRAGILGGTYDVAVMPANGLAGMAKNGDVKILGYMAPARHPEFPDTPTTGEAGYKTVAGDFSFYWWVPKDTPDDIKAALTADLDAAFHSDDVQKKIAATGMASPEFLSGDAVDQRIAEKTVSIDAMAKDAGLAAK